jgi:uncharacterized membrane protein YeaQ/YmgE (transglycosylase-associated protein family)
MSIVWTAIIGLASGVIARLVAPGRKGPFGLLLTIALGIVGAFAATYLGQEAGWYRVEESGGLIAAFGAVVVLLIWVFRFRSRRPTSSM